MAKPHLTDQATTKESIHDQRTALVKGMVDKENAERDAKTARLRAQRLAKESEAPPPKPVKPSKAKAAKAR